MRDPYEVLGVARSAAPEEIRQAYRGLAKGSHPDLHPGDAKAEARFKEISAAHDLLSDPTKRARFDRGEIDAEGNERPMFRRGGGGFRGGFGNGAAARRAGPVGTGEIFGDAADLEQVFADLFGGGAGARAARAARGGDVTVALELDLPEAASGGRRTLALPDGRRVEVAIPAGVEDGHVLRLAGMGGAGLGGGPRGDAYVEVRLRPHPVFERRAGGEIRVGLPVTLAEAVLGGRVTVPTVSGPVTMTIPKGSNTGTLLRLKGKGMPGAAGRPAGDQVVRLEVALPAEVDPELAELVERWEKRHRYDPRAGLTRDAKG